jgi:hypothetical protein
MGHLYDYRRVHRRDHPRGLLEASLRPALLAWTQWSLREKLRRYLHYYNTDRARTGMLTKGRTPDEVIALPRFSPDRRKRRYLSGTGQPR